MRPQWRQTATRLSASTPSSKALYRQGSYLTHLTSSNNAQDKSRRIVTTLYRQLLRWCHNIDPLLPLSSFVPPAQFTAPEQVEPYRLQVLAQLRQNDSNPRETPLWQDDPTIQKVLELLPRQTGFLGTPQPTTMILPIHSVAHVRNAIRIIFRLNRDYSADHQKDRIDQAFGTLKRLNELGSTLKQVQQKRAAHNNNNNSNEELWKVGQVVQHQRERWRGVVVGIDDAPFPTSTTLTTKSYQVSDNTTPQQQQQQFQVILDAGDALMRGFAADRPRSVPARELTDIGDTRLTRIRSTLMTKYFDRYDASTGQFCPNALTAYQYPDTAATTHRRIDNTEKSQVCRDVIQGVRSFCQHLQRILAEEADGTPLLLPNIVQLRLAMLASQDDTAVLTLQQEYSFDNISDTTLAAQYLQDWLLLTLEIFDVLRQRRTCAQHAAKFRMGDVVRHQKYNFRGVVVAWDPQPTVDVSHWDGLQDIAHPAEQPFYHVIPDPHDCVRAFGGTRPFRYVCQENLELCRPHETDIDVDLGDPDWRREQVEGGGFNFIPPSHLLFKYAQENDGGVTERCINRIEHEINTWQYQANQHKIPDDSPASQLSMKNLMTLLLICDTASAAAAVQDTIKELRKAHCRSDLRWRLDAGVSELIKGRAQKALDIFRSIVDDDPDYVEGWNKLATCEFMVGESDASLEYTHTVLSRDPKHFQALNGLGLIHFEREEYTLAAVCFQRSIDMDPWSPVASKLAMCTDLINRMKEDSLP